MKSVAQSLHGALQCSELKELCSAWQYESELENLERTVATIKAVLLDAEGKHEHELSHQAQLWIEELTDAMYDADDLFDELTTLAEQKRLMLNSMEGGDLTKKVRLFFSRFNPLVLALKMSQKVKQIRDKLDAIARNHSQFSFNLDCQPTRMGREETSSYVYTHNIIGREDDTQKIIHMLLNFGAKWRVSFLSIVGIGGLGKTTLVQLVYNHPRVEKEFPVRLWVSVADVDKKDLAMDKIYNKIMQSTMGQKYDHGMDHLRKDLQKKLARKKFLLVLDDVWCENPFRWLNLKEFLITMGAPNGSWVVVTTRSKIVAGVVGDLHIHELKGLSEEDSWCLFERTAFGQGHEQANSSYLVEIGKEIVKRCANVPLAIRVVGSLLYGHNKEKWQLFQEIGIGRIKQGEDGIEPILKLSYHNLESSLKMCFSYCALFPKGFVIKKEMLISLWMAQGFIFPFEEGQSIEDAGEEYFSILLRRCFFQDEEKDEYGEIVTCKMHDLMHDIAEAAARKEICAPDNIRNLDKRARHLSLADVFEFRGSDFSGSKLRTYLRVAKWVKIDDRLVLNGTRLRVLDLSYLKISISLHMVGKLLHLRYLDLSGNLWLEELPESIVQLQNLQTLKLRGNHRLKKLPEDLSKLGKLRLLDLNNSNIESLPNSIGDLLHLAHLDLSGNDMLTELSESIMELHRLRTLRLKCCDQLRELPKDLSKLVKLRLLDITGCWEIHAMPHGMQKLSCLQTLPLFVVGETNSNRKHCFADQLEGLKALNNLRGHLEIRFSILQKATYVDENGRQGGYLRNKEHLTHITIDFKESDGGVDCEEALLEDLQPHSNLKRLQLSWYCGKRMPSWARKHSLGALLPHLVEIHLVYCDGLQCLASLGTLCHLKSLIVEAMSNLLYIENTSSSSSSAAIASKSELESFFPSLEELKLEDLPKLKGWWSDNKIFYRSRRQERGVLPSFPRLLHLHVWRCPKLSCIPLCPTTERVTLGKSNRRLRIMESQCINSKLRIVYTEDIRCLNLALPVKTFSCLEQMEIRDDELKSFSDVSELLRRCSFSLRSLVIDGCPNLRNLCGGLEYLAALETLHLRNLPNLNLSDGEDGEPWLHLRQSLRFLSLEHLHRLVTLPEEIHHLTSLQSLFIRGCRGLQSLPCSIRELFSLKQLEITDCSGLLKKRCQRVTGEDWCNIQHIPEIVITTEVDMDSDEDNDSEYSNESDSGHCL